MDMTIRQILTLLQSEYPQSFSRMDDRTMALKAELWEREFSADNPNLVYAAIRTYMRTPERFAPSIGQVREIMTSLTAGEELQAQDAWAIVSKACQNGLYGYREEFAKLPPDVQAAVGAPEQLKAWAMMDADTVESVVASNFMRSFRTHKEREKARAALPPEMRTLIDSLTEGTRLKGRSEGFRREILLEPPKPVDEQKAIDYKPVELDVYVRSSLSPEDYVPLCEDEWEKRKAEINRKIEAYKEAKDGLPVQEL